MIRSTAEEPQFWIINATNYKEDQIEKDHYLAEVKASDLIEFGMIPEFVGKFPALVPFHYLTECKNSHRT